MRSQWRAVIPTAQKISSKAVNAAAIPPSPGAAGVESESLLGASCAGGLVSTGDAMLVKVGLDGDGLTA